MDKDLLLANIDYYCKAKKIKPTPACVEAGVGRTFVHEIKRGQTPSVAKIAALAAYLGVTTSDLVGDARDPPGSTEISELYAQLNEGGQEILVDYARHLVYTKKYAEHGQGKVVPEENIG